MVNENVNEIKRIGVTEILGKEIEFYGSWEEPLFKASEVAKWLDERDGATVSRKVDDDEKIKAILPVVNSGTHGGFRKNTEMLFLTEKGVKQICANSRKPEAKHLLEYIANDTYKYKKMPPETNFAIMLRDMIKQHKTSFEEYNGDCNYLPLSENRLYNEYLEFEEQYLILDYRVDFYFPHLDLIVEYDEKYHKSQHDQDVERMNKIVDSMAKQHEHYGIDGIKASDLIRVIRVKEGREVEGLTKILTYMMSLFVS